MDERIKLFYGTQVTCTEIKADDGILLPSPTCLSNIKPGLKNSFFGCKFLKQFPFSLKDSSKR